MKRRRVDLPAGRAFRRMALFLAVLIISGVAAVVWASEPPDAAVKNGGARAAGAASRGLPTRSSVQAGALRRTVARPRARNRKALAMRAPSVQGEMPGVRLTRRAVLHLEQRAVVSAGIPIVDPSPATGDLMAPDILSAALHVGDGPAISVGVARRNPRLLHVAEPAELLLAALPVGLA
jgi:hypothetical protein